MKVDSVTGLYVSNLRRLALNLSQKKVDHRIMIVNRTMNEKFNVNYSSIDQHLKKLS